MLDKKYFAKLRSVLLNYAEKRRELIKLSGDAQQKAKKSIFAFQRDDADGGHATLKESLAMLNTAAGIINSDERLSGEGSYRAALEEYIEADLFRQCVSGGEIGQAEGVEVEPDLYISGLCDVPGELYRYAIHSATAKKFDRVALCHELAEEIIAELVDMDLTGYNRQKFDQAKQALQKLEQVVYEVSMKRV